MDRWPGAYPASEPPTPAPETPQQQQQQPKYPVHQQHADQKPTPLTQQQAQTPAENLLAMGSKPHESGTHATQEEAQRQPDARGVQQQPHGVASLSHGHQPSDLAVAYQQQPRGAPHHANELPPQSRAAQQEPQEASSRSHSHGQVHQHGCASPSHDHQPSDLPLAYQERAGVISQQPHELRHESRELSQHPRTAEQQASAAEKPSTGNSHAATGANEQASTPAYWGNLPTAPTGGIYNTVTGHGSPRDDHDQHHNLPNKNRVTDHGAADATIPSAATSFPTGGIYNSVTGHGRNHDSTKHQEPVGTNDLDAAASRVPLLGAGQSRTTQPTTEPSGSLIGTKSAANEDSITDDSSSKEQPKAHDAKTLNTDGSMYGEARTQRAFPLATSDRDGRQEDKATSRAEQGLAAGAAAGAGVAAYDYSGKRDKQDGRETWDNTASNRHTGTGTEQRDAHTQQISHLTHADGKRTPPNNKDKNKEHHGLFGISEKPASEDKRDSRDSAPIPGTHPSGADHRVLQAKPQAQPISPPNAEEKHKHHRGFLGLGGKHTNEEGRDPRDIAPIPGTHPSGVEHRTVQAQETSRPNAEAKRSSLDGKDRYKEESPKRKSSVLGGIFHRHKVDTNEEDPKYQHRRSDSTERRKLHKEPPPAVAQAVHGSTQPNKTSAEEDRHRHTGAVGGTLHDRDNTVKEIHAAESKNINPSTGAYTSASHDRVSAVPTTRHGEKYDETSKHDHEGALTTGAGVAVGGLAASELAYQSSDLHDTTTQSKTTSHAAGADASGPYNVLPSGTASGVATGASHQSFSPRTAPQAAQAGYDPENFNHQSGPCSSLATGTASGDATPEASGAARARNTMPSAPSVGTTGPHEVVHSSDRSHPYDTLESGTSSSITTGAGPAPVTRFAKDPETYDNSHGSTGTIGASHGLESNIPSGSAASGDDWRSSLPPTVATTRVGESSVDGTLQERHSTKHSAGNSIATQRPTETYAPTGTMHDAQSSSHAVSTIEPHSALESGSASSVAKVGEVSSHSGTHTASHGAKDVAVSLTQRHKEDAGDMPKPYNVLPSGTPSGVNIEYKRRSKEIERQY
ncbi:hypothetical protein BR93DRAFT_256909 [Coniochaeta sp. PMI_546]|nr:hypothetical protein BR93DRAFT_256909 [Coniochaeta sp. PMI_546]